jgi:hypothetical protein
MKKLLILLVVICTGCTSITKDVQLATPDSPQAEVVIYRPGTFAAGCCSMFIGLNDKYFGALRNNQYISVKVNAGTYDFQVKGDGSPSSSLRVNLKPDTKVCLASNINPATAGVVIIPLVANMIAWFQLGEVPCPNDDFFADYTKVVKS